MADIAMCKMEECPWKEGCYRYNAPKSMEWQSWFSASPGRWETTLDSFTFKCEYYWPMEERCEHSNSR